MSLYVMQTQTLLVKSVRHNGLPYYTETTVYEQMIHGEFYQKFGDSIDK